MSDPGDFEKPESAPDPAQAREEPVESESPPPPPRETVPAAPVARSEAAAPGGRRPTRPDLLAERTPVSRGHADYVFVLEPGEIARLRELPGARGKTDEELGGEFLEANLERLAGALAGDVGAPATIQVLVDPYARQAFLAMGNRIVGIVSF